MAMVLNELVQLKIFGTYLVTMLIPAVHFDRSTYRISLELYLARKPIVWNDCVRIGERKPLGSGSEQFLRTYRSGLSHVLK
jgi:hypothetical protein